MFRGLQAKLAGLGLRSQLALLAMGATLPLFALVLAGAVLQRGNILAFARLRAESLASQGAERTADTIRGTRNLLTALAEFPGLGQAGHASCALTFPRIAADRPELRVLVLVDPTGRVLCASRPVPAGLTYADRGWFRRAMAPGAKAFVLSHLLIGRLTHFPIVVAAVPLPPAREGGRPAGVLAASLNLRWLAGRQAMLHLPAQAISLVVESVSATVLARFPGPAAWIGRRLADGRLRTALRTGRGGTFEGRGLAGRERIFGLARAHVAGGTSLSVAVGLSRQAVLHLALRQEVLALTVALIICLLALLVAWQIFEFSIIRPIRGLAETATRIGAGDLAARPPLSTIAAPEFRAFGVRLQDMAERLGAAQAGLQEREAHFRLLAENTTDMIVLLDPDLRRLYVSPASREMFGYTPAEMLARSFRDDVLPEDGAMATAKVRALTDAEPRVSLHERFRRKDGTVVWVESNIRRLPEGEGFVVSLRDITLRKAIESELEAANQRLEALAWEDSLTGLGNRRSFDRRLENEFRRAHRSGEPLALVMIDVDRFKPFNDLYGHPMGDECLRAVAGAVGAVLRRPADHGARYGGEEIALLLPATDEAGAFALAEHVRQRVRALGMEHVGNEGGVVTVSAGVAAIVPQSADDSPSVLVRAADRALYAAKASGRDAVRAARVLEHPLEPAPDETRLAI